MYEVVSRQQHRGCIHRRKLETICQPMRIAVLCCFVQIGRYRVRCVHWLLLIYVGEHALAAIIHAAFVTVT
jgi:hypothetical protein